VRFELIDDVAWGNPTLHEAARYHPCMRLGNRSGLGTGSGLEDAKRTTVDNDKSLSRDATLMGHFLDIEVMVHSNDWITCPLLMPHHRHFSRLTPILSHTASLIVHGRAREPSIGADLVYLTVSTLYLIKQRTCMERGSGVALKKGTFSPPPRKFP
jgi:hypothetical protein